MLLCGYLNTSWCKNITTISEPLNIKSVFLMHNFECIGLTELPKRNKQHPPLGVTASRLDPFGTLRSPELSNRCLQQ